MLLTSIICMGVPSSGLVGQVPQTLSYQGLLTTSGGTPVPDSSYDLTFKLYAASSGGTPVWTESRSAVPVTSGTFSVILGSVTTLSGLNLNHQLYLGVTKGGDPEFSPRTALTSSPSSLAPWSINGSNISFANGNVGIGTSTPSEQLELTGNLRLPVPTATTGIIYSGVDRFIHGYGFRNFFGGAGAGNLSTAGFDQVGVGFATLGNNTTGYENTAIGYWALRDNGTGYQNTACGDRALTSNTSNHGNTAIGAYALNQTTASDYNTALGFDAGWSYNNGYNNVFVGANVDVNANDYYNVIAMGQGTRVMGPSEARFGNSATISYGGWAGWTTFPSDERFKRNIKTDVPGIAFINKLRPVTYNLEATALDAFLHRNDRKEATLSDVARATHDKALREKEAIRYTGFIAQEVEAAAKELGFDFSGVDAPKNENETYGLRYAEFVVPLVKAVQEQQKMIDELKKEIESLKRQK